MKKIISTIIALAMIMTMVNIPVVINADTELVNITDDYSSYTTDTALDGWYLVKEGTTATFGAVDGGVEMRQVDPIPTINYLSDFTKVASQSVEFGSNLKQYTKTVKATDIATAIIPLGSEIDDGDSDTENKKLTIESVNNGVDYVYDKTAVALYGWIFKVVSWDDVTVAANLKDKAEAYLEKVVKQNVTIELNAIDLHLLDRSIESFNVGDYIRVISEPHNFAETLLCQKQTIDLLKPENDTITLGYTYSGFAETVSKISTATSSNIDGVKTEISALNRKTNSYKIAEQNLTSLMAQSFGVFKTQEVLADGSTISYLHDSPTLETSVKVWKMTGSAFAVSSDGGKTWSAGIDANGNAIMNVLSVIGINASWLNVTNLAAICANIGGWNINEQAIYKDVTDPNNSKNVCRVCFQPPLPSNVEQTQVLSCQKSTDGGKTFSETFVLFSDGSMRLGESLYFTDSYGQLLIKSEESDQMTWLEPGGLRVSNYDGSANVWINKTGISMQSDEGSVSITPGYLSINNPDGSNVGARGSFTTADGKTVTVQRGFITSIE